MEPKRYISYHIQLFHTFGVVIVLWGIVFYVAINTFGVGWYLYIIPHHPEGIDRYVENDAPTLISMPKVWILNL